MVFSSTVALQGGIEAFAAFAHPADLTGGDPCHQRMGFHVLGDNGTGSDEGTLAHCMAAHHRAVSSQRRPFANSRLGIHAMHWEMRPWCGHIGKDTTRSAKDIVLNLHSLIDGDIVLYADAITDMDVVAYVDILS